MAMIWLYDKILHAYHNFVPLKIQLDTKVIVDGANTQLESLNGKIWNSIEDDKIEFLCIFGFRGNSNKYRVLDKIVNSHSNFVQKKDKKNIKTISDVDIIQFVPE